MNELDALGVALAGTNLIEASAGTGKTQTITTLFLRLVLESRLEVGEILVVTYTNAATAELRTRIRERLARALAAVERDGAPSSGDDDIDELLAARRHRVPKQVDRGRLALALRDFDQGAIHTIHGFCQRVLHEHAFESGTSFDTELLTDQTTLVEEVVRDFWVRELSGAPDVLVAALRGKQSEYADLVTLATRAGSNPDLDVVPRGGAADLADAIAVWRRAFERAREAWRKGASSVIDCLVAADLKKSHHRAEDLSVWRIAIDRAFGIDEPMMRTRFAKLDRLGTVEIEKGRRRNGTPVGHEFFPACDDLLAAEAMLEDRVKERLVRLRVDLVDYVRTELPRRKEAANVQHFDDLLHRLQRALDAPGGSVLAERVRKRFPAALIDEFQDTDPVQYSIFHRIYQGERDAALFLIGDPKQAIYAFRGADVFAYMTAKRDAASGYTLQTNWRSDPRLLDAVNYLFDRIDSPFVFDAIPYRRVKPRPRPEVGVAPDARPQFSILFATHDAFEAEGTLINKGVARRKLPRLIAAEISRLLASRVSIEGAAVRPSDIAVLCRTNRQAADVQVALRELAVPSVLQGDASVFDTQEAAELERVVAAMAEPGDRAALHAAMVTPIGGMRGEDLYALQDDERAWDEWATLFQSWNDVWQRRGFTPAFRRLLDECGAHVRLLGLADGERRLTNVLHLGELLQTAVRETRRGPLALVEWLGSMRRDAAARAELGSEAAQIRLESDERALKLTTIHKSKGLEYPVVFAPYLWDGRLLMEADKKALRFHDPDDGNRLKLDVALRKRQDIQAIAEREALAENLRLLYVALTRAKHTCTLVWGPFNEAATSALGYLLHRLRKGTEPRETAAALAARIAKMSGPQMREDIVRLVSGSAGAIELRDISTAPGVPYQPDEPSAGELDWRRTNRVLARTWRTGSFSSLVAGGSPFGPSAEEGIDRDEETEPIDVANALAAAPDVTLADFPTGPRSGRLVHEIFERLDFRADEAGIAAAVGGALTRYGLGEEWSASLCRSLGEVLDTPLADGFTLREVPRERRLVEVEFVFPIADTVEEESPIPQISKGGGQIELSFAPARGARSFTSERLAGVLALREGELLSRSYVDSLRRLGFRPLAGFLKGYIDLVFEHGGRWWVVDYKSNLLGRQVESYGARQIARAMEQHHYYLQYHLYVVAMHRYLRLRLEDYDYERHFGGVLYLFLRGMGPNHPRGCGVFRDRPPLAVVEGLSRALASPSAD